MNTLPHVAELLELHHGRGAADLRRLFGRMSNYSHRIDGELTTPTSASRKADCPG